MSTHVPMTRSSARRRLALLLLICAASAPGAAAQSTRAEGVTVAGVVVDSVSGQPVPGARVAIGSKGAVLTDTQGRFVVARVPQGAQGLVAHVIGFRSGVGEVEVEPGMEPIRVALVSDPVVLAGVTVEADRLRSRRNAAPVSVRLLDRSTFALAAGLNARDFVLQRAALSAAPCTGASARGFAESGCVRSRGSSTAPRIIIDEHPAIAGLDELAVYRPEEIYMAEIYDGGRQIRVYTNWFMERAARGKLTPEPFIF